MSDLHLHRDEPDTTPNEEAVYRFPSRTLTRQRLVSRVVDRDPMLDIPAADGETYDPIDDDGPIKFPADPRDAGAVSSPELVRQIELTLDRMQRRLNRFKSQLDDSLKFPPPFDEDGPTYRPPAA